MNQTQNPDWAAIAAMPEFQDMLRAKRRFLLPCCAFFSLYYLAFLVLVGWFSDFVKQPVWGKVNLAYLLAISQFVMTWVLAYVYMRRAKRFDRQAAELLKQADLIA